MRLARLCNSFDYGLGQAVILGELIHQLTNRDGAQVVWVGLERQPGTPLTVAQALYETGVDGQAAFVMGQVDDPLPAQQRLLRTGIAIAAGATEGLHLLQ